MRRGSFRLFSRRALGLTALVASLALTASACTSTAPQVVVVTVTSGQQVQQPAVSAPELSTPAQSQGSATGAPTSASTTAPTTVPGSDVRITATPAFGAKNVPPNDPVKVTVFAASITQLTLAGDDGREIAGAVSSDKASWTNSQRLTYATTYTYTGIAAAKDGKQTKISGKFTTVKPTATERASVQIPNGDTVGVAAPIIVTFSGVVKNRAKAEAALKVTTSAGAALQGNWGWVQDEQILAKGPVQSQVHWRPTKSPANPTTPYWPAFTKVHVEADLKGVDYGNGQWGREDFVSNFSVGRSQIVVADASTHKLIVTVDDKVTKNYAVSYGKESVPGRATVNGIHVVTEKHPTFKMCNPKFDYCNVLEKWAVRINNNGEFIHQNLKAKAAFGIANISHGCINMGEPDAQDYYNSTLYGDPVVVSNTDPSAPGGGPAMSEKDALYDWIYSPSDWLALSAL